MKPIEQQIKDKELYNEPTHQEIFDRNEAIITEITSERPVKCVVPVSGGKDSQVCLKLAVDKFGADNVIGMFCDTDFEHPLTYEHIEVMKKLYNVRIIALKEGNVYDKIRKVGRFPADIARFCTDQLKIVVGKRFYKQLSLQQGEGFEVWYGMRLGESWQRSERYKNHNEDMLYPPHEIMVNKYPKYLFKQGVTMRLPILTWEEEDVFDFLGDDCNQLYKNGFERVGCFPCLAAGDKYKEKAFSFDEVGKQRRIEVVQLGHDIGKNPFTTKGGRLRNPDADPDNVLDVDYNPNNDELAPCFHCNI